MRILLSLFLLAAAVAAGVYFADNPGQVEIVWQGWLIDTSVGVLVAARRSVRVPRIGAGARSLPACAARRPASAAGVGKAAGGPARPS